MLTTPAAEPLVGSWRADHDWPAAHGVPAHVDGAAAVSPHVPLWTRAGARDVHSSGGSPWSSRSRESRIGPEGSSCSSSPTTSVRRITAAVGAVWPELPPHKDDRPDLAYRVHRCGARSRSRVSVPPQPPRSRRSLAAPGARHGVHGVARGPPRRVWTTPFSRARPARLAPPWTSTSTRARSSSAASASRSPTGGSRRRRRRRARPPRSSAARSSSRRRCSPAAAARRAASSSPTGPDEAEAKARDDPRPRHPRPRRPPALDRAGVGHREGVLPLDHVRPRREEAAAHAHDRGRRRHRGGRGERRPEALARLHVDPLEGFQPWQARRLVYGAGIDDPGEQKQIVAIVEKLYAAFVGCDAMLCEINPLIVTPDGRGEGARLEVHGRRQRALPAPGHRRDARRRGGRPAGARSRARRASPT